MIKSSKLCLWRISDMTDNFSFRSAMNGFNRNDVIRYIDEILAEKAKADDKVAELEREVNSLKSDNEALRSVNAEQSEKLNSASKCNDCEIVKIYEARLGAAMLDAKRFSEILVKEANDKAASLFADAFTSADRTAVKASDISHNIAEINKQFDVSFKQLLDNMNNLGKSLEAFKREVKTTGDIFDFSTDFVPILTDKAISAEVSEKMKAPLFSSFAALKNKSAASSGNERSYSGASLNTTDESVSAETVGRVNFDDADEFDIRVDMNV